MKASELNTIALLNRAAGLLVCFADNDLHIKRWLNEFYMLTSARYKAEQPYVAVGKGGAS